jgi:hypothetical protein
VVVGILRIRSFFVPRHPQLLNISPGEVKGGLTLPKANGKIVKVPSAASSSDLVVGKP